MKKWIFIICILYLNSNILNSIHAEENYYWKVIKVINNVSVKKNNNLQWSNLKANDKIYEGDFIKTDNNSSVLLLIDKDDKNNSYTQLFENTILQVISLKELDLNKLKEAYLDLILGKVLINIQDLPTTSTFKVKTPAAVAGVRGTNFLIKVQPEDNLCSFLVFHGIINIFQQTKKGPMNMLLKQGEQCFGKPNEMQSHPSQIPENTIKEYFEKDKKCSIEIQTYN